MSAAGPLPRRSLPLQGEGAQRQGGPTMSAAGPLPRRSLPKVRSAKGADMSVRGRLFAGVAAALAASIANADVTLENGWLRPAYAGQPTAMVYVDIQSTEALELVAAKSPVAKGAQLVLVDPPGAEPDKHRVVKTLPVAAKLPTRLAYLGSHVRLLDIQQDLRPGATIPLELTFVDAKGARRTVSTDAVIRGIAARRPEGTEAGGSAKKP